jgi:hypothetical protein
LDEKPSIDSFYGLGIIGTKRLWSKSLSTFCIARWLGGISAKSSSRIWRPIATIDNPREGTNVGNGDKLYEKGCGHGKQHELYPSCVDVAPVAKCYILLFRASSSPVTQLQIDKQKHQKN